MNAVRISPTLGAIVSDLDLSATLSDGDISNVRTALDEHLVLFFRNQTLTPVQQRSAAARFGELYTHPFYPGDDEARGIIVFDHGDERKAAQNDWHTDVTYIATPPQMSLLYGEVIPQIGGDTLWASMYAAYEALSPDMKHMLAGLRAVHDFSKDFPPERFSAYGLGAAPAAVYAANPPVSHPVVRQHVTTGRKALYVNSSFTTRVEGLHRRESEAILRFLFEHVAEPEFQIRWRWMPGDVALWDNHWTQHYAVSDYSPHRRRVRRATIMGGRPT
jgi:taurine dioxygenase